MKGSQILSVDHQRAVTAGTVPASRPVVSAHYHPATSVSHETGRSSGATRSLRDAIEHRMREVLAGHDPARGSDSLIADVRAAFGVPAEGLPFGDAGAISNMEGICRLIETNLQPSPLVACLQPAGTKVPLFLIHAGGGYVFFYRALASHLAPDHPVYGIRAETETDGLGHRFDRWQSLEQLAAHYIARMKAVQPRGPYSVGGGSFGGVVAFEMARQLRASGDSVCSVLLFCPELLTGQRAADAGRSRLSRRVAFHLNAVSQLETGQALRYISSKILNNAGSEALGVLRWIRDENRSAQVGVEPGGGKQPGAKREPLVPELTYRCIVNMRAAVRLLVKYKPEPYEGSIVMFRGARDRDPVPEWEGLARGGMHLHDAPGGHLDLLEEPTVGSIAAIVKQHLA